MLSEHIFLTVPGKHTLHVRLAGYRGVHELVNVAQLEPGNMPKAMLVWLQRE